MAQHDLNIANATFPATRTDINNALSAIQTTHSGTSAPPNIQAGQIWLDTTSPTTPTLKYYDGADNISLATLDHSANTVNWLDSTVSITGLSSTATGTVLTLTDSASTSTVNLIIDNQKEIRFNETTANGTNYVALKAPASLTSDLTFTLPSAHGTSGQFLSTNGSGGVLSFASASFLVWQSVKTADFTAVKGEAYPVNTTSVAITVTLPATPSAGDQVQVVDYAGTADTFAIIIDGNGEDIEGSTDDFILIGEREGVILTYIDSTQGWIATSGVNEGTDALEPITYLADFLVIAGGGGGGGNASNRSGGGGGAGGYRNSFLTETSGGGGSSEASLTFDIGIVYTVTVGGGGATGTSANGTNGQNSVISGTGISTITSTGGGGGGFGAVSSAGTGSSGGSGGGGGVSSSPAGGGGSGTANQGFAGGAGRAGSNNIDISAGGGGGAGAVGVAGASAKGGNGGAGLASSITGSSVLRAGGGGGATLDNPIGTGGTGGGGDGAKNSPATAGTSGTINTGSGGGGSATGGAGGGGGKGVVILRMPTARYSGTTTGSPTVTTSGTDTILTFNDSGSYTG